MVCCLRRQLWNFVKKVNSFVGQIVIGVGFWNVVADKLKTDFIMGLSDLLHFE